MSPAAPLQKMAPHIRDDKALTKTIGILTAGGDSPGLNAAIRGVGKAALQEHDMHLIGFCDGFRGLIENRYVPLTAEKLSGILTIGGTILGTSRDKPHKMLVGNKLMDMTDVIRETYQKLHLDALVCIGGGGTQKNAFRLTEKGLNIITLPKTIDNDVAGTDYTFGFDTALSIATEAIDRLHSTAHSHHRIIVVELMGHKTGWLALGAGLAGGADVILIPEIPYEVSAIAESIRQRSRCGRRFSIVAVSEGALSREQAKELEEAGSSSHTPCRIENEDKSKVSTKRLAKEKLIELETQMAGNTFHLATELEHRTGLESRVTILGHVQRGGTPSAMDRILATRLGTACVDLIRNEVFGIMVAAKGETAEPVALSEIVGQRKSVPLDHPWIQSARALGVCLGNS